MISDAVALEEISLEAVSKLKVKCLIGENRNKGDCTHEKKQHTMAGSQVCRTTSVPTFPLLIFFFFSRDFDSIWGIRVVL